MGIEKWYEVSCDVCGETIHTRTKNKEEIEHYGFILKGNKVFCSKECYDTEVKLNEIYYRENSGKLNKFLNCSE